MYTVSLTQADEYTQSKLGPAVDRHFDLLGLHDRIRPGMKLLLKPNLLMKRSPDEATTTHPAVMEAIIVKLQSLGISDITIADSPGGPYTKTQLNGIYAATGMADLARRTGVKLNLDTGFTSCPNEQGKVCSNFNIINPVKDADYIISVCKLKTHGMTALSCAVKNIFGTIPGLQKPEMHMRFPETELFCDMLIDLALLVKPRVTFVDAVVAMEGDGPSAGIARNTGFIAASSDPFALDMLMANILNMDEKTVSTVALSVSRGLCPSEPGDITVLGDVYLNKAIKDFKHPSSVGMDFSDKVPRFLRRPTAYFMKKLSPRPVVKEKRCTGCAKCFESCPAKTISMENKKAHIDYSRCIKCFCCHEMCPTKSIEIKKYKFLNRW